MSRTDREVALKMAQQKMQEARRWWGAWENGIHQYRSWALLYVARSHRLRSMDDVPFHHGGFADRLRKGIDQAHDMLLIAADSIASAARAARSCEMMSRIYYEEYEERETGVDRSRDDDRYFGVLGDQE